MSEHTKINKNINCVIDLKSELIFPKDVLTGTVTISSIDENCVIDSVKIEIVGEASCKWQYNKCLVKFPRIFKKNQIFSGNQQFFLSRHTLSGGELYNITLNENARIYPFKSTLSDFLPGTWKGEYGQIEYMVKVLIKEIEGDVRVFTKEVIVSPHRNLCLEDNLLYEARRDIHRQYFYSFINLGSVNVNVWLPFCGIASGQSVPLLCTITNDSTILFGGLIFILTQIEIYRSKEPINAVKTFRKDICRVARMVNILKGTYEYYSILQTNEDTVPTNQYIKCNCCQVVYEVWVSLQAVIPRYQAYGYPNLDTPPIPLIIGTEPIRKFDTTKMTNAVMNTIYQAHPPIIMEPLPPDDEVEEMLITADEILDEETEQNLIKQLITEPLFLSTDSNPFDSDNNSTENTSTPPDTNNLNTNTN